MSKDYFLTWLLIHGTPFAAFALGVWISIHLRLNNTLSARAVWLMAIPVALLTVGNFVQITYIEIPVQQNTTYQEVTPGYTYMGSYGNFLLFTGTLIFYGTAVPKLFEGFRERFIVAPPTDT